MLRRASEEKLQCLQNWIIVEIRKLKMVKEIKTRSLEKEHSREVIKIPKPPKNDSKDWLTTTWWITFRFPKGAPLITD